MKETTFAGSLQAVATGLPLTRLRGAMELLCAETNLVVAQVNGIDLASGTHTELVNLGHQKSVSDYYRSSRFTTRCMGFLTQWERPDVLMSWEDIPGFRDSYSAVEVLRPSGFENGMSTLIKGRNGTVVGVCNVNCLAEEIAPQAKPLFACLRPTLGLLIEEAQRARTLGLSPRELEILRLVAAGLSNREIGQQLFVAPRTVSTHMEHILGKLEVSNRVQAAMVAVRVGLLPEQ